MSKRPMDAATVDQRISALQAEDDVIRQRLAELDAMLTTWLAAIGQEPLVIEPESAAIESEPTAGEPEPAAVEEEAVAEVDEPGIAEAPVADTPEPPTEDLAETSVADPLEPSPAADVREQAPEVAPAADGDEDGPARVATDEDEALLATLDEETANAIRVRRRISRGKRSVRELLEEIQSARPSAKRPGPQRKRWWRSRND